MSRPEAAGVVLCAGHGTRLRPASMHTPKPGVPFMGRPIAWYSLELLRRAGVKEVGVNLHHLPEKMQSALETSPTGDLALRYREETEILGTGGGLRALWADLGSARPVVLLHGDVVLRVDLAAAMAAHRASGAAVTLVLRVRDPEDELRNVFLDETGEVAGLFEHRRPKVVGRLRELSFTGVHIIEPEVFDWLPERGFSCLVSEVYPRMLREGVRFGSFITTNFYADLGTYDRFLTAQSEVFEEPSRLPLLDWPEARAVGVHVDADAVIDSDARLIAPVRIGAGVRVSAGAVVGPEASLSGAIEVGPGVRCERCSIWGAGRVDGDVKDLLLGV